MNLLLVSECFPPAWSWGGLTRSMGTMSRALVRAGARVRVITTDSDRTRRVAVPPGRVVDGVEVTTLRTVGTGLGPLGRFALAPRTAQEVARQVGWADLAVLQGIWCHPFLAANRTCRRRGLPYVVSARGMLETISLSEKSWKKRLYRAVWLKPALAAARAIHYDTEDEMRRSADASFGRPGIVHPTPLEIAPRVVPDRAGWRRRHGIAEDARLLGLVGRLHPRKGFDVILPALSRVEHVTLVAIGNDEDGYGQTVDRLAREHGVAGRCLRVGALEGDELQSAYASIDGLVLPSHGESYGNVVIEALAQGTPVCVSDRVPLGRYAGEHGLGRVVSGLDPREWAAALAGDWTEVDDDWRRRACERVRRDFDLEACGRRMLADLEALRGASRKEAG